jgi:hypothetical protein
LLVLDTNIVRQSDASVYHRLRAKGFRLALASVVVTELAARAYLGPSKGKRKGTGSDPGLFYGPARCVAPYLDGACPVLPSAHQLTDAVLVDGYERERVIYEAVSTLREGWEVVLRDHEQLMLFGNQSAPWLEEHGEYSTRINDTRGAVRGLDWRDGYEACLSVFLHDDPRQNERFHVMMAMMAVRCAKMGADARGFKDRTPNDTPDLMLVGSVGLGAFVATADIKSLLTDVRESGTYQAPWIRTVDEYLAAERLPSCAPWGDEARREAKLFADELNSKDAAERNPDTCAEEGKR